MEFKATLEISTTLHELPPNGFPAQRFVEENIIPFFQKFGLTCDISPFWFHASEADEVRGINCVGIQYIFHRPLKQVSSYCDLVKLFEGTVSLFQKLHCWNDVGIRLSFS